MGTYCGGACEISMNLETGILPFSDEASNGFEVIQASKNIAGKQNVIIIPEKCRNK
jgi:hypothetical protein